MSQFNDLIHQYETACHNLRQSLERLTEAIRARKQGTFAQGGIVPRHVAAFITNQPMFQSCTFAEDICRHMTQNDDKTVADCQTKPYEPK